VFTYNRGRAGDVSGFFASTGLEAMDYWITDEILHPMDTPELSVETIYRCHDAGSLPTVGLGACRGAVSHADGKVVFGSFSNLLKLTPAVIETWAALLKRFRAVVC